jgi:hypothetical protein
MFFHVLNINGFLMKEKAPEYQINPCCDARISEFTVMQKHHA